MIRWLRKAYSAMVHPTRSWWSYLPGTRIDYAKEVGTGFDTGVLMAPVQWIGRAFPEAPLVVRRAAKDDTELVREHPLLDLLVKPNPHMTGLALWRAIIASWCLDGNAYLLKLRTSDMGPVKELWYAPHWMIEPYWEGQDFITYYRYTPGGQMVKLLPEDVVHLRCGIDPNNTRKGLSDLASAWREAFTDNEAANYTAAILRNMGVPGMLISPEEGVTVNETDMENTKQYVKQRFTGDRRGEAMVLRGATKITQFGFSPRELDLSVLRDVPEERVCALLGLPAAVVGFGTGMEQTKVGATMEELRRLAWTGCINPMQTVMAADLTRALGPDFDLGPNESLLFDTSAVQALQEERAKAAERVSRAVLAGVMTRGEGRRELGLDVQPEDDVFLVPISSIETPRGELSTDVQAQAVAAAAPAKGRKAIKRLTSQQARLLRSLDRVKRAAQVRFEGRLKRFLRDFGDAAERIYLAHAKDDADELHIEWLFSELNLRRRKDDLRDLFAGEFIAIHKGSLDAIAGLGLAMDVPDTLEQSVLHLGAQRSELVNLSEEAKRRALEIIRAGREEGQGPAEIARLLRDAIPAGPWSSSAVRAAVTARTETRFAQNYSTLQSYRNLEGVNRVMMLDARLGPTDEECQGLNEQEVSFEQAEQLIVDEHPNGTRDLVPVFTEAADAGND